VLKLQNDTTTGTTGTGLGNTSTGLGNTSTGLGNTSTGLGNTSTGLGNTSTTTSTGAGMAGTDAQYDSATNTGAPGVTGYDNTRATGVDSAGYNTVSGTGATTTAQTTGGVIDEREIIDSKTFTKTVDHEVLIEKKQYELEHRPVQEQYVVETRKVGEARVPGAATELVGTEANEVDHRIKEAPRGDRTVVVQDVDVPLSEVRETTTTGMTGTDYGTTATGMTGKDYGTTGTTATGREI
jgi:hypothetical protein